MEAHKVQVVIRTPAHSKVVGSKLGHGLRLAEVVVQDRLPMGMTITSRFNI